MGVGPLWAWRVLLDSWGPSTALVAGRRRSASGGHTTMSLYPHCPGHPGGGQTQRHICWVLSQRAALLRRSPTRLTGLTLSFRDQSQPALGRQGPGCHGDALGSVCGRPWAGVPWHCPGTGDPSWVVWCRYMPTISCLSPSCQVSLAESYLAVSRGSELCPLSFCPSAGTDFQRSGTSAPIAARRREGWALAVPGDAQAWGRRAVHLSPVTFVQVEMSWGHRGPLPGAGRQG